MSWAPASGRGGATTPRSSLLATLHPHPHPHPLALAHAARSLVLVLGWDPDPSFPRHPLKIHLSLAADDGHISALQWLTFGDLLALALGTSAGLLFVYSLTHDLVDKQVIHPGRVLRMRFGETKAVLLKIRQLPRSFVWSCLG